MMLGTDDLARLEPEERQPYFEQAAAELNLSLTMVEKDFWVCWLLRRLFNLPICAGSLTFKGGTTLSKVFNLIERFSEDIDISVNKELLGFGGDADPESAGSKKEKGRRIKGLQGACAEFCSTQLAPELTKAIEEALGSSEGHRLYVDEADPQTLFWAYPRLVGVRKHEYVAPEVKIELGARSDHYPVQDATIHAYVVDALPEAVSASPTSVQVLEARRTFWEKATILHRLAHKEEGRRIAPRMSRHYYDMHRMAAVPEIRSEALGDLALLTRVALHMSIYFEDRKAHYELAQPGSLKLVPPSHVKKLIQADYESMGDMFFSTTPTPFHEIVETLRLLELEINGSS